MQYNIHGDKIIITDAIKEYILNKLQRLDKYIKDSNNISGRVIVRIRGHEQIIEVTIPIKQIILRAEESHSDLYAAIDLVVEKLERQIIKNKTKLLSRLSKEQFVSFDVAEDQEQDEKENLIVKRKKIEMKPMNEEDAILEMNLIGHDFFVFKDRDTNKICVLYKRKDGNYGIIES